MQLLQSQLPPLAQAYGTFLGGWYTEVSHSEIDCCSAMTLSGLNKRTSPLDGAGSTPGFPGLEVYACLSCCSVAGAGLKLSLSLFLSLDAGHSSAGTAGVCSWISQHCMIMMFPAITLFSPVCVCNSFPTLSISSI